MQRDPVPVPAVASEAFTAALNGFALAAAVLADAWQQADHDDEAGRVRRDDGYSFGEDFAEIVARVLEWRDQQSGWDHTCEHGYLRRTCVACNR